MDNSVLAPTDNSVLVPVDNSAPLTMDNSVPVPMDNSVPLTMDNSAPVPMDNSALEDIHPAVSKRMTDEGYDPKSWKHRSHGGMYRRNQFAQWNIIKLKIFDLVVLYKDDPDHPLSNVRVIRKDNKIFSDFICIGGMNKLSDLDISCIRKEFAIVHDRDGLFGARCTHRPSGLRIYDQGTGPRGFYIVEGHHEMLDYCRQRHEWITSFLTFSPDLPMLTKPQCDAIKHVLYTYGFGQYEHVNVHRGESVTEELWYEFYDRSDPALLHHTDTSFQFIFKFIEEDNIPLLFMTMNLKVDQTMIESGANPYSIELCNTFTFSKGPYRERGSMSLDLSQVSKAMLDEHFHDKSYKKLPIVQYRGKMMYFKDSSVLLEKSGWLIILCDPNRPWLEEGCRQLIIDYLRSNMDSGYCTIDKIQYLGIEEYLGVKISDL